MKVFLDPGHGHSVDTGAQGNGLREQDITYQIAQKVGLRLKNKDVLVKYSRELITDNVGTSLNSSLAGRYTMANTWQADLFVSIHCNAHTSNASGTETLIYNNNSPAYNLANIVNSNLVNLGFVNRGIKIRTDLAVLRYTNMPAILIEVGFITNASDAKILSDRQDEIAQAISNAIFEYMGVEDVIENAEQALEKIVSKGVSINKDHWLTACNYVKWLDELLIKIANKM